MQAVVSADEVERKFEAASVDVLAALDLGVVLAHAIVAPAEERLLEAVYHDTPDLALLSDHVTMRRRTGGPDEGWHAKLSAAEDRREEIRVPLTPAEGGPPAELLALVRASARGRPLRPVAELRTRRRAWQARDGRGALVAELVIDEVTARSLGPGKQARQMWVELEVETGPAAPVRFLDAVEDRLSTRGIRRSANPSKLARALAGRAPSLVDPTEAVGAAPQDSAAAVVLAYLDTCARALRHQDPRVRLDREDAVHQMRVAARRMRSALQVFGRVLEPDRVRALTDELRWLAGELAPARDTEVMHSRLEDLLAEVPPELVLGAVHAELAAVFARRTVQARVQALTALDSPRYIALLEAIDALIADPPLGHRGLRDARRVLPGEMARVHRRVVTAMETTREPTPHRDHDVALHEARKALKRLRYTREATLPALGAPPRRWTRRITAVQDLLGAHQDSVLTRATLLDLASGEIDHGFTLGVMYAVEATRARQIEPALTRAWARVPAP